MAVTGGEAVSADGASPSATQRNLHTSSGSAPSLASGLPASTSSSSPLLLEGDQYCVSSGGMARTFYELVPSDTGEVPPIAIEEQYNIQTSHKTFVLRREVSDHQHDYDNQHRNHFHLPHILHHRNPDADCREGDKAPLGPELASLELQEIDHGVLDGVGTGSTTWESSIAMALYFSAHPDQVRGKVLELGSGVGLGGILSSLGPRFNENYAKGSVGSITLTDTNDEVLHQCRHNVQGVFGKLPKSPNVIVSRLDWNDVDAANHETYDTVIACDCAYRTEDIGPLGSALKALVREDPRGRIHLFGPNNRAVFHEIIRYMIDVLDLEVAMELINVNRFRLKPEGLSWWRSRFLAERYSTEEECTYSTKQVSYFLHVIASYKTRDERKRDRGLSGLD